MAKPLSTERATSARGGELIASAVRTLEAGASGITTLSAAIHDGLGQSFIAAVDLISAARGRLIVTGMGKSGHVGRKIAATFASTGTPAFFVHPSEASHGDLGMITPDDAIMALSWSGETAELKDLIDYSRRFRIGLIAVTAVTDSTLGRAADVVLAMPQAREACPHNLAPTTSTLMQAALGDALAIALLESRGFTAIDFGHFHPGGRLGAMLKFVRDIIATGAQIPIATLGGARRHAYRRRDPPRPRRRAHGGGDRRDDGQDLRLRRHHRPPWPSRRHHHRRRSAPAHERQPARPRGRGGDDAEAAHGAAGPARQRGAGAAQLDQEDAADRGRRWQAGRRRAFP